MSYNNSYNKRPFQGRRPSGGGYGNGGGFRSASRRPAKAYINPSRFIKAAKPAQAETAYVPTNMFADFEVDALIHRNIAAKGFTAPSPIQDQAIPAGLKGQDVIGIANTGTGKTVAFAVPMLQKLLTDRNAKALIMAPTRELAQQIEDECRSLARNSGLFGALLIGGSPMGPQFRDLSARPRVVIGTPGRIKDHIGRGSLDLSGFNIIVLDEVDRMLDMGFVNDIRSILSEAAEVRQSFFFSATMDPRVSDLIRTFANEPVTISVKSGDTTDTVDQNVVTYSSKEQKLEKLHDLLNDVNVSKAIVFDDTQRSVEKLHLQLQERGFRTDAIHGGKSQGQRQRALNRFKSNDITILVATDVAARGIDVSDITHVVNYSTPQSYEDYVHRIGRAGRAGRTGYALTFIEGR